jgi:AmmeMemoRadiSam system protein B
MLSFSAITPHPPMLIPAVGRDNLSQIKKTQQAMQEVTEDFYASQPESVIVISPHGQLMENAFTINMSPNFTADFKQFGDLETKLRFKGDVGLIHQIKESLETSLPIQMVSNLELDHGVSVPLYYLTQNMPKIKIVPMGYSFLNNQTHFELGQKLAEIIHQHQKRIAVVASGDLSHCLTSDAPAGYNPQGKKFDKQLVKLIKQKDINSILNLDQELVKQAMECGLKSVIILMGILSHRDYQIEILSYEWPFGVGYLVSSFKI